MKIIPYILPVMLSGAICAHSQTDLDKLVQEVAVNNKNISASARQIKAQQSELSTENNLPDPEVGFSHLWGQHGIGTKWGIEVSQSFDWPGVYGSRKKEIRLNESALTSLHQSNVLDAMLEIKSAMIDIIHGHKLVELHTSSVRRIDSLTKVYKRGYELGEISLLDINKLKIERLSAVRRMNEAATTLSDAIYRLSQLSGSADCSSIIERLKEYPLTPIQPLATYTSQLHRFDPMLAYNRKMSQAMQQKATTARRSNLPGFSLGYSHEYEMGERFNGFSVSLTLPVFSGRGKVRAARDMQESYSADYDRIYSERDSELKATWHKAMLLSNEIEGYAKALDDDNNIRLLDKAFQSGHITLMEYFLELNYFIDAQAQYLDLQYSYQLCMARLNRFSSITTDE